MNSNNKVQITSVSPDKRQAVTDKMAAQSNSSAFKEQLNPSIQRIEFMGKPAEVAKTGVPMKLQTAEETRRGSSQLSRRVDRAAQLSRQAKLRSSLNNDLSEIIIKSKKQSVKETSFVLRQSAAIQMSTSGSQSSVRSQKSLLKKDETGGKQTELGTQKRSTTPTAGNNTIETGGEMAPIETRLIKLEKTKDKTANMQQHQFILRQPDKASLLESATMSLAALSQSSMSLIGQPQNLEHSQGERNVSSKNLMTTASDHAGNKVTYYSVKIPSQIQKKVPSRNQKMRKENMTQRLTALDGHKSLDAQPHASQFNVTRETRYVGGEVRGKLYSRGTDRQKIRELSNANTGSTSGADPQKLVAEGQRIGPINIPGLLQRNTFDASALAADLGDTDFSNMFRLLNIEDQAVQAKTPEELPDTALGVHPAPSDDTPDVTGRDEEFVEQEGILKPSFDTNKNVLFIPSVQMSHKSTKQPMEPNLSKSRLRRNLLNAQANRVNNSYSPGVKRPLHDAQAMLSKHLDSTKRDRRDFIATSSLPKIPLDKMRATKSGAQARGGMLTNYPSAGALPDGDFGFLTNSRAQLHTQQKSRGPGKLQPLGAQNFQKQLEMKSMLEGQGLKTKFSRQTRRDANTTQSNWNATDYKAKNLAELAAIELENEWFRQTTQEVNQPVYQTDRTQSVETILKSSTVNQEPLTSSRQADKLGQMLVGELVNSQMASIVDGHRERPQLSQIKLVPSRQKNLAAVDSTRSLTQRSDKEFQKMLQLQKYQPSDVRRLSKEVVQRKVSQHGQNPTRVSHQQAVTTQMADAAVQRETPDISENLIQGRISENVNTEQQSQRSGVKQVVYVRNNGQCQSRNANDGASSRLMNQDNRQSVQKSDLSFKGRPGMDLPDGKSRPTTKLVQDSDNNPSAGTRVVPSRDRTDQGPEDVLIAITSLGDEENPLRNRLLSRPEPELTDSPIRQFSQSNQQSYDILPRSGEFEDGLHEVGSQSPGSHLRRPRIAIDESSSFDQGTVGIVLLRNHIQMPMLQVNNGLSPPRYPPAETQFLPTSKVSGIPSESGQIKLAKRESSLGVVSMMGQMSKSQEGSSQMEPRQSTSQVKKQLQSVNKKPIKSKYASIENYLSKMTKKKEKTSIEAETRQTANVTAIKPDQLNRDPKNGSRLSLGFEAKYAHSHKPEVITNEISELPTARLNRLSKAEDSKITKRTNEKIEDEDEVHNEDQKHLTTLQHECGSLFEEGSHTESKNQLIPDPKLGLIYLTTTKNERTNSHESYQQSIQFDTSDIVEQFKYTMAEACRSTGDFKALSSMQKHFMTSGISRRTQAQGFRQSERKCFHKDFTGHLADKMAGTFSVQYHHERSSQSMENTHRLKRIVTKKSARFQEDKSSMLRPSQFDLFKDMMKSEMNSYHVDSLIQTQQPIVAAPKADAAGIDIVIGDCDSIAEQSSRESRITDNDVKKSFTSSMRPVKDKNLTALSTVLKADISNQDTGEMNVVEYNFSHRDKLGQPRTRPQDVGNMIELVTARTKKHNSSINTEVDQTTPASESRSKLEDKDAPQSSTLKDNWKEYVRAKHRNFKARQVDLLRKQFKKQSVRNSQEKNVDQARSQTQNELLNQIRTQTGIEKFIVQIFGHWSRQKQFLDVKSFIQNMVIFGLVPNEDILKELLRRIQVSIDSSLQKNIRQLKNDSRDGQSALGMQPSRAFAKGEKPWTLGGPLNSFARTSDEDNTIRTDDLVYSDKFFVYKLSLPKKKKTSMGETMQGFISKPMESNKFLTITHISIDCMQEIYKELPGSSLMQEILVHLMKMDEIKNPNIKPQDRHEHFSLDSYQAQIEYMFKKFYRRIPNIDDSTRLDRDLPLSLVFECFTELIMEIRFGKTFKECHSMVTQLITDSLEFLGNLKFSADQAQMRQGKEEGQQLGVELNMLVHQQVTTFAELQRQNSISHKNFRMIFSKPLLHLGIKNAMILLQQEIEQYMTESAEKSGHKRGTKGFQDNFDLQLRMMEKEGAGPLVHQKIVTFESSKLYHVFKHGHHHDNHQHKGDPCRDSKETELISMSSQDALENMAHFARKMHSQPPAATEEQRKLQRNEMKQMMQKSLEASILDMQLADERFRQEQKKRRFKAMQVAIERANGAEVPWDKLDFYDEKLLRELGV